jgi:hypothetical protein
LFKKYFSKNFSILNKKFFSFRRIFSYNFKIINHIIAVFENDKNIQIINIFFKNLYHDFHAKKYKVNDDNHNIFG